MAGGETSLGSCFDDYEILNGMMTLRHDDMMERSPLPPQAGNTCLSYNDRGPHLAKTEHSHPLGMVVSTHFRCGKGVKRGLKNGALPFNID